MYLIILAGETNISYITNFNHTSQIVIIPKRHNYNNLKNSARLLNIETLRISFIFDSMKLEVIYIGCAY